MFSNKIELNQCSEISLRDSQACALCLIMNVFLYLVLNVWNYDVSVLTLSMCYKIIYGLVDIPCNAFFKFSTRGHPLKLYYSDSRINERDHSFPVHIVTLWNRLPAATVLSGSLQSFKKLIYYCRY